MAKSKSGGNPRSIPEGKTQVNFNINNGTLEKVKVLSLAEGVTNSDIYNRSVEKFVELYEAKNGKIKPVKSKGLDL